MILIYKLPMSLKSGELIDLTRSGYTSIAHVVLALLRFAPESRTMRKVTEPRYLIMDVKCSSKMKSKSNVDDVAS